MTVEILRIREGYVTTTTTIFTLMLQNGWLVLVAPHFQNQYKKCQRKAECLFEVLLHVSEEERCHVHPRNP